MGSICRNLSIICNIEGATFQAFYFQFKRALCMDVALSVVVVIGVIPFMDYDRLVFIAGIGCCGMYVLDAILMGWLLGLLGQGLIAGSLPRIMGRVHVNVISNWITIAFYAVVKGLEFQDVEAIENGQGTAFNIFILIFPFIIKLLKVLVMMSFRKWLRLYHPDTGGLVANAVDGQARNVAPLNGQNFDTSLQGQNTPTPGPTRFVVVCPPGAYAGQTIQVQAPNGKTIATAVPAGIGPGQQFAVQL